MPPREADAATTRPAPVRRPAPDLDDLLSSRPPPRAAGSAPAASAAGTKGSAEPPSRAHSALRPDAPAFHPKGPTAAPAPAPSREGRLGGKRRQDGGEPRGTARARGRGRAHGKGRGQGAGKERWWSQLTDVDPISLEPLAALPYEPFKLATGSDVDTLFDPTMLASYLISTGSFMHPISRRPLTQADCEALDCHLAACGLKAANVADSFKEKANAAATTATAHDMQVNFDEAQAQAQLARVRADVEALAESLRRAFYGASRAPRGRGAAVDDLQEEARAGLRAPVRRRVGARGPEPPHVSGEGNVHVIDDDAARHVPSWVAGRAPRCRRSGP